MFRLNSWNSIHFMLDLKKSWMIYSLLFLMKLLMLYQLIQKHQLQLLLLFGIKKTIKAGVKYLLLIQATPTHTPALKVLGLLIFTQKSKKIAFSGPRGEKLHLALVFISILSIGEVTFCAFRVFCVFGRKWWNLAKFTKIVKFTKWAKFGRFQEFHLESVTTLTKALWAVGAESGFSEIFARKNDFWHKIWISCDFIQH